MGIEGLWPWLKKNVRNGVETLSGSLRGSVVAVDASIYLFQLRAFEARRDEAGEACLLGLWRALISLKRSGVHGVFIFDGRAPEAKRSAWDKRRKNQREQRARSLSLERDAMIQEEALRLTGDRGEGLDVELATHRVDGMRKEQVEQRQEIQKRWLMVKDLGFDERLAWAAFNAAAFDVDAAISVLLRNKEDHHEEEIFEMAPPVVAERAMQPLAQLVDMGFDRFGAQWALVQSGGDVVGAAERLSQTAVNHDSKKEGQQRVDEAVEAFCKQLQQTQGVHWTTVTLAMELIKATGHEALVAPMEAEALCAQLAACKMVDYCATEDGDAFLFGAPGVLRSLVRARDDLSIVAHLWPAPSLHRAHLICAGILAQCDYCDGIESVGFTKALSIVQDLCPCPASASLEENCFEILERFCGVQRNDHEEEEGQEEEEEKEMSFKLRSQLQRLCIPREFLSQAKTAVSIFAADTDVGSIKLQGPLEPDQKAIEDFATKVFAWKEERIAKELSLLLYEEKEEDQLLPAASPSPAKKNKVDESPSYSQIFQSIVSQYKPY